LRQLLQQVELLRSSPELLRSGPDLRRSVRSDLRRSRELRRSRRELLRCAVELLPPFELLQPEQGLLPEELLPPLELLPPEQGLLPEELLLGRSELLRSGPELRCAVRSDLCRSDLRRSLQLSESVKIGLWSRLETITRLDGVQPARRGFL
jgi:hypothetical protein